jgi:hypothetical protein
LVHAEVLGQEDVAEVRLDIDELMPVRERLHVHQHRRALEVDHRSHDREVGARQDAVERALRQRDVDADGLGAGPGECVQHVGEVPMPEGKGLRVFRVGAFVDADEHDVAGTGRG